MTVPPPFCGHRMFKLFAGVVPHNVNSYFLPCMVVLSAAQLGVYNRLNDLVTLEIWDNKCKSLSFLVIVLWFSNFHVFSASVL